LQVERPVAYSSCTKGGVKMNDDDLGYDCPDQNVGNYGRCQFCKKNRQLSDDGWCCVDCDEPKTTLGDIFPGLTGHPWAEHTLGVSSIPRA
jgi:hypothetical protein